MIEYMNLLKNINTFIKEFNDPEDDTEDNIAERFGETTTPNMRALRLSMTVADFLLSMNIPASDVVGVSLDITDRYCKRKISIDISSTILMFSQDRGNNREPLTLIRTSVGRPVNSTTIQALQELASDIRFGNLPLDDAEKILQTIIDKPREYPRWLLDAGNGSISAGVGTLLSGSIVIVVISFIVGALISRLLRILVAQQMPAFFIQAMAATLATMIAALFTWLSNHGFETLKQFDPNLIIIGGIVMLVSGLAIVGAVEDAIDEYYVTANARILRVAMMTAGIIAGVVFGLYVAGRIGVNLEINTNKRAAGLRTWQYILSAVMISGGYALSTHSRLKAILLSGLIGATSLSLYIFALNHFTQVIAVFIASVFVGGGATFISRLLKAPSTTLITAGVIPLVPGLALFNGLMVLIIKIPETSLVVDSSAQLLVDALLVALAIAAGATLGRLVTRPLRRTLIRAQNALPVRKLRD